jgi:hypothetical protein
VADRPHVGLVDAHAERVRRDDHVDVAGHEPPLRLGARVARQARVVGEHGLAERAREPLGQLVGARARPGVDDRREGALLRQRRDEPPLLVGLGPRRHHGERQVRPVEAGRDLDRVLQRQPRRDVGGDLGRRRRRRRDDRLRPEPAGRVGEAEVVGAEVVAPLRDAVRLVDDEEPDPRAADLLEERRRREALRRDVEQAVLAADRALDRRAVDDVSCCALTSPTQPGRARSSASTWSCMSETSGETTIVRSSRMSAGSW